MIEPFEESLVSQACISYGVSSYGYDFRVDRHYRSFSGQPGEIIDPKEVESDLFEDFEGDCCVVPPGSFVLGKSVEYFRIPRDILTICTGKSTYARCGVLTNITPFEPEWEGFVTMAIFNTGPAPVRVYSGRGDRPGDLPVGRRNLHPLLPGPERQVPGTEGHRSRLK